MNEALWLAALVLTGALGAIAWMQRERWIRQRRARRGRGGGNRRAAAAAPSARRR